MCSSDLITFIAGLLPLRVVLARGLPVGALGCRRGDHKADARSDREGAGAIEQPPRTQTHLPVTKSRHEPAGAGIGTVIGAVIGTVLAGVG